ncbi:hypothetical protein [Leptolyngbya sp. FACHB-60]|uniref:hypothetical protein n=1 Tax=unclassified Leptolyngbya TaxID=2650499 RepID=UPI001682DC8E
MTAAQQHRHPVVEQTLGGQAIVIVVNQGSGFAAFLDQWTDVGNEGIFVIGFAVKLEQVAVG